MLDIHLLRPVDKRYPISQHFGARPEVYQKFGLRAHEGLDIAAPRRTPVHAAADGIVWKAGSLLGNIDAKTAPSRAGAYGNRVIIKHLSGDTAYFTIYAHLDAWSCVEGETVEAGKLIGYVGTTGNSTGYHLHFSLCLPIVNEGYKCSRNVSRRTGYKLIDVWYHDPLPYLKD